MNTPALKLKLNTKTFTPSTTSTPPTPLATPGGTKLKLKFGAPKSTPSSPAPPPLPQPAASDSFPEITKKTKNGRTTKPTAKLIERKRAIKEQHDTDDEGTISVQQPAKKLKLSMSHTNAGAAGPMSAAPKTPGTVILKTKIKGKIPARPAGVGYDSEASDRELDPAIEEQFVMRMIPGPDCDYLQQCIAGKKFGIPKSQGGAEVYLRFFNENGRRGVIRIRDRIYATTLVDLPCIVEGMKSWDKRGWWKSADICQLLLIFSEIEKEEEAKTIALPPGVDPNTFQYPHGLTAPMHYARKRVFRKRVSKTTIEAVESEVDRLLKEDDRALESKFEMMDPDRHGSQISPHGSDYEEEYSGNEDAEGEEDDQMQGDYFGENANAGIEEDHADQEAHADALAAELEAEMMAMDDSATPASTLGAPSMAAEQTPIVTDQDVEEDGEEYDSGDESVEDEDEPPEIDIEAKNREKLEEGIREDIRELERQLAATLENLARQANPILRKRVEDSVRKIKNELQLKKSSINEGDDEDS